MNRNILFTSFFLSCMVRHGLYEAEAKGIIRVHIPIFLGLADETDVCFMKLVGKHPITLRQCITDHHSIWVSEGRDDAYDYS